MAIVFPLSCVCPLSCCRSAFLLYFNFFFFLMTRHPPRSPPLYSSAASDVYKRQAYHLYCIDRDVQPSVPDGGTSLFQWELGNDDFPLLPCYHGTRFLSGACCKVSEGKDEVLQPAVYCTGVGTDMDFSQRMADHTGLHTGRIGLWCYPTVDL